MTPERRAEIFARDVIGIKELQEILDIASYSDAADLMRAIRAMSPRPNKRGKCFVQDYIEFFGLDIVRYCTTPYVVTEGRRQ